MQTYFIMNSKMVTPDVQKAMVREPEGIPTDNAQSVQILKHKNVIWSQGRARKKTREAQD